MQPDRARGSKSLEQNDVAEYLDTIRIECISFFDRQLRATTVQIPLDLRTAQSNLVGEPTVSERDWTVRIDPVSFNSPFHRALPEVNVPRHRGLDIDSAPYRATAKVSETLMWQCERSRTSGNVMSQTRIPLGAMKTHGRRIAGEPTHNLDQLWVEAHSILTNRTDRRT